MILHPGIYYRHDSLREKTPRNRFSCQIALPRAPHIPRALWGISCRFGAGFRGSFWRGSPWLVFWRRSARFRGFFLGVFFREKCSILFLLLLLLLFLGGGVDFLRPLLPFLFPSFSSSSSSSPLYDENGDIFGCQWGILCNVEPFIYLLLSIFY